MSPQQTEKMELGPVRVTQTAAKLERLLIASSFGTSVSECIRQFTCDPCPILVQPIPPTASAVTTTAEDGRDAQART